MDWLHKTKHKDEENSYPEKKIEDSDSLQNKIHSQQDHLDFISKKLESVKDEYGEALSNLILVKKELIEKKKELENFKSKN